MTNAPFADYIGKKQSATSTLYPEPIERMEATFGWQSKVRKTGEPIPPGATILYFLDAPDKSNLGREGHRALGDFLPPIPLPKRMAAGLSYRFYTPLCVGDQVTKTTTIASITKKHGASGALFFIALEHIYSVDNKTCIVELQDIVYREDTAEKNTLRTAPKPAPTDIDDTLIIEPDPVLLFRYSALTFNGHRIHYDLDYARHVEGYPTLVFHGPMTASILLHWAYGKLGVDKIKDYQIRFISPLFADKPVKFVCKQTDECGYQLWAINPQGHIAAQAQANA